jgi:ABC-type transport system involved in multi-copper enzyme maturation permease subunit
MIKALLWKEWREQRWKLTFGVAMLFFFTGAPLAAGIASYREVGIMTWMGAGLMLALYSAMGIFAPEQTEKTHHFLRSQPAEPWKVFMCKWLFGWLNFTVPLLASSLCFGFAWVGSKGNTDISVEVVIRGTIAGIALATVYYGLILCFAPRKGSEAMVGLVGLIAGLACYVHAGVSSIYFVGQPDSSILEQVSCFVNPFFWLWATATPDHLDSIPLLIVVQSLIFCLTVFGAYRRWYRSK